MKPHDIIVIGAGIVGVSTALALQMKGRSVCILDRSGVAAEASRGNAGAFAFADIIPLATPGIMRKAPKWLLDPMGPLSIPPAYALKIAPWMLRFWRASWADRYGAAVTAQADLMALSRSALVRQIAATKGADLIRQDGQLELYEGERAFRAGQAGWAQRRAHGIAATPLQSPEAIAAIQKGLHRRFTHAMFTPDWMSTTDPRVWTDHLAQQFCQGGGQSSIVVRSIRLLLRFALLYDVPAPSTRACFPLHQPFQACAERRSLRAPGLIAADSMQLLVDIRQTRHKHDPTSAVLLPTDCRFPARWQLAAYSSQ